MSAINAKALAQNFVDKLPEFSGETISGLVGVVEAAEGQPKAPKVSRVRPGPALPHTPDACDYIILKALPPGSELPCGTVDCKRRAVVFSDSRDGQLQPQCAVCAHVEFAMWMVGI